MVADSARLRAGASLGSDLAGLLVPGAPPAWMQYGLLAVLVCSGVAHLRRSRGLNRYEERG